MRLAVNYSPQAAELLDAGVVAFDLYKCPDWPDLVSEAQETRPVYVHFPLMAGKNNLNHVDWDQIEYLLSVTETGYINLHIAPFAPDFPGMALDTRSPADAARVIDRVVEDVTYVKQRFGADRIILENVPWDADPKYAIPRPVIEPEVVSRLVKETGCGFLLDTAHARIAALHLGMDPIAYLDALPGEHMRELHITGTVYDEDASMWRDHFPMTYDDWQVATRALENVNSGRWPAPEIVALEYGGVGPMFAWRSKSQVLAVELARLRALVDSTQMLAVNPN
jgi:uncharacterized protein (UPF0276 family)